MLKFPFLHLQNGAWNEKIPRKYVRHCKTPLPRTCKYTCEFPTKLDKITAYRMSQTWSLRTGGLQYKVNCAISYMITFGISLRKVVWQWVWLLWKVITHFFETSQNDKQTRNILGHSNLITCLTSFFGKKNPVRLQKKKKKVDFGVLRTKVMKIFLSDSKKKKKKSASFRNIYCENQVFRNK